MITTPVVFYFILFYFICCRHQYRHQYPDTNIDTNADASTVSNRLCDTANELPPLLFRIIVTSVVGGLRGLSLSWLSPSPFRSALFKCCSDTRSSSSYSMSRCRLLLATMDDSCLDLCPRGFMLVTPDFSSCWLG